MALLLSPKNRHLTRQTEGNPAIRNAGIKIEAATGKAVPSGRERITTAQTMRAKTPCVESRLRRNDTRSDSLLHRRPVAGLAQEELFPCKCRGLTGCHNAPRRNPWGRHQRPLVNHEQTFALRFLHRNAHSERFGGESTAWSIRESALRHLGNA